MAIYQSYTGAKVTGTNTGYKAKAWIALPEWITTDGTVDNSPTDMGDSLTITTAPTFASGKGWLPIELFRDTTEAPGEASGEIGSKTLMFKPKVFIKGDNAASLELIQNIINQPHLLLIQKAGNNCTGQIQQYGSKCDPAEIENVNPASGTLRSGRSGIEVTYESTTKLYWDDAVVVAEYP